MRQFARMWVPLADNLLRLTGHRTIITAIIYEQLRHMDIRHFVILECRHLANCCV